MKNSKTCFSLLFSSCFVSQVLLYLRQYLDLDYSTHNNINLVRHSVISTLILHALPYKQSFKKSHQTATKNLINLTFFSILIIASFQLCKQFISFQVESNLWLKYIWRDQSHPFYRFSLQPMETQSQFSASMEVALGQLSPQLFLLSLKHNFRWYYNYS